MTSCDLDMDPETAIRPEDAYTMEYCEGVRGYVNALLDALNLLYTREEFLSLFEETT